MCFLIYYIEGAKWWNKYPTFTFAYLMKKTTAFIIFITTIIVLITVLSLTIYQMWPIFDSMINDSNNLQQTIDDYLQGVGWFKAFLLVILQGIVVLLAVIPAEPVQIVAGLSYGFLYGAMICLIGVLTANIIIYIMFKKLGDEVVKFIPFYEKWESKIVDKQSESNRMINIIVMYIIPVIPYGVTAYIASRAKLKFIPYILITTLGALPSIIVSTLVAGSVLSGNIILTVITLSLAVIVIIGAVIFKIILHYKNKKIIATSEE